MDGRGERSSRGSLCLGVHLCAQLHVRVPRLPPLSSGVMHCHRGQNLSMQLLMTVSRYSPSTKRRLRFSGTPGRRVDLNEGVHRWI